MAKMLPSVWDDRNDSRAEAVVYRRLRDETPEDWTVVHSVGLASHARKPWTEVDFVVVADFGVLCLEVKGGHVKAQGSTWFQNERRMKESPFRQAASAAAGLFDDLKERIPNLSRAIVGHGVVFPDFTFDVRGAEIEPAIVFDERDLHAPMRRYLERVAEHWKTFHGRVDDRFRPLSLGERGAAVDVIAPSFDRLPTLRARVAQVETDLIRLTKNQTRILRGMRHEPRALIRGGAGTGKTLLAVEEAERYAADGLEVLLCCRSPLLARYLEASVANSSITVRSYDALLRQLVDKGDRRRYLPDASEEDLLALFLPEQACEAIMQLELEQHFDVLVLDEAQDLLIETALDVFELLLADGLDAGTWRVFYDHKQNVFSAVDRRQFDRLQQSATSQYELFENCRNTPQISDTTAMVSATQADDVLADSGPEVEVRYALDHRQAVASAATLIDTWVRRGVDPADTVLIWIDDRTAGAIERHWPSDATPLQGLEGHDKRAIRLVDTARFKGLESAAAVVIGIEELEGLETLRKLYVACSRPRALLGLVLAEDARDDFGRRATDFARRNADRD